MSPVSQDETKAGLKRRKRKLAGRTLIVYELTRNTCMQQPFAYILQTLFQHEVLVITSTLNAGSGCSRHVSHGNTIIVFSFFVQTCKKIIDETLFCSFG
jgi:hypothetical protein